MKIKIVNNPSLKKELNRLGYEMSNDPYLTLAFVKSTENKIVCGADIESKLLSKQLNRQLKGAIEFTNSARKFTIYYNGEFDFKKAFIDYICRR